MNSNKKRISNMTNNHTHTHTAILSTQLQANELPNIIYAKCAWASLFFLASCKIMIRSMSECVWLQINWVYAPKKQQQQHHNGVNVKMCVVKRKFKCRQKRKLLIVMEHIFSCRLQTLIWSSAKSNEPLQHGKGLGMKRRVPPRHIKAKHNKNNTIQTIVLF